MIVTADELEQNIKTAYGIAKRSGIEEPDLLNEAFKYALNMMVADKPQAKQHEYNNSDNNTEAGTGTIHEKIARGLDLPLDTIELLYDINDGELALNLPTKALPDSASAAMREIAVLLAVGRKHAGISSSTPFEVIRIVCDEHGKLDKKNFAAAMSSMKPRLTTAGKGTDRELVPKRPADDLAKEIINRYGQIVG